jgi:endonuclease YncB( thermonuclease family)
MPVAPWLLVAALIGGGTLGYFLFNLETSGGQEQGESILGRASVIDGDTIEIRGQRIRLHGIDAPESAQACRLDGKPWMCGKDAADALAKKISRRPITCEDLGRDRYERILARCTVDGEDLGEWLVANGWAVAYYQFSYEYSRAELRAKLARRGIWAGSFMQPEKWRRKRWKR